ncbi:tungsten ABC transporter substrate-binding protein [Candidatus Entotheonella serta]|nr:tungsten ABC transporter substrate-binding protein [Candidatus Entotheonella serta]
MGNHRWQRGWLVIGWVMIVWVLGTGMISAQTRLRLATTTSTENSGLLQHLLPIFEQRFEVKVDVIAVGTGRALKLGENGDVDVVLVHAPQAEDAFVQAGFGVHRRLIMANDFVLLGPPDDPAQVHGQPTAAAAIRQIASQQALFVSRGDDSGTNKKERWLWQRAGIEPSGQRWYLEVGQGMGATLQIAHDKLAYTLTDRGTFLTYRQRLALHIVHERDPGYDNPYSAIAVNPQRHAHVAHELAVAFINWLISIEGQQLIGNYRKHDQVLFYPRATNSAN